MKIKQISFLFGFGVLGLATTQLHFAQQRMIIK